MILLHTTVATSKVVKKIKSFGEREEQNVFCTFAHRAAETNDVQAKFWKKSSNLAATVVDTEVAAVFTTENSAAVDMQVFSFNVFKDLITLKQTDLRGTCDETIGTFKRSSSGMPQVLFNISVW